MPLRVSLVEPLLDMTIVSVLRQIAAQFGKNLVHAVRVGVVEKIRFHPVGGGSQGVGHELRPQCRTADADDKKICKR